MFSTPLRRLSRNELRKVHLLNKFKRNWRSEQRLGAPSVIFSGFNHLWHVLSRALKYHVNKGTLANLHQLRRLWGAIFSHLGKEKKWFIQQEKKVTATPQSYLLKFQSRVQNDPQDLLEDFLSPMMSWTLPRVAVTYFVFSSRLVYTHFIMFRLEEFAGY